MSKAGDFLKDLLISSIKDLSREFFNEEDEKIQVETKKDKEKVVEELEKLREENKKPNIIIPNNRFTKISDNLTLCKNIYTTTFCNLEDFKEEWYPLATNSPYSKVQKGKMKDMRGVSLSIPIKGSRIVYPINPSNGVMFGYKQVDVGPGYTNDNWIKELRAPKNETGIDQFGRKSVKAGLDVWPQIWEDFGYHSFEDAYEHSYSHYLDVLIWEPVESLSSKVKGHEIPSSDSREWFNDLPYNGSEYFSWKELLRGWNKEERPSNQQINNLISLTKELLHPLRISLGRMRVTNGLRDLEKNKEVGGREGSMHLYGRAVDLIPLDTTMEKVYEWCKLNLKTKIRELLHEYPNSKNEHLHIS